MLLLLLLDESIELSSVACPLHRRVPAAESVRWLSATCENLMLGRVTGVKLLHS